ncbi:hypothetical protein EDC01DRAFT_636569 [Geopyxis carbonaria]|nr:hypothetical protein EDC01DRAFT_636569 [Geopyxis carbonaria]
MTFCVMCFSAISAKQQPLTLRACGHQFHTWCLLHWYLFGPAAIKDSCPICRTNYYNDYTVYTGVFETSVSHEEQLKMGYKMGDRIMRKQFPHVNVIWGEQDTSPAELWEMRRRKMREEKEWEERVTAPENYFI